jgi:hypothetical protein
LTALASPEDFFDGFAELQLALLMSSSAGSLSFYTATTLPHLIHGKQIAARHEDLKDVEGLKRIEQPSARRADFRHMANRCWAMDA